MRRSCLCAFLSVVSIAALHALPAAAERPMSQERWMLRQNSGAARTSPQSEVRVHFFNPNQRVRVSQRSSGSGAPPALRPTVLRSRPAPARPLIVAANQTIPRLLVSHAADAAPVRADRQPGTRSGR